MQNAMKISNKYMEYVMALAQHQTISAAADAVFISQPAMSHFIRSLEDKMGFKLFNRIGNRYIPTYEGERYLYYARRILLEETQMYNEFADIKNQGKGLIRFALPALRSAHILPQLVSAYRREHPHVELKVREAHSQELEKMLLNGEVDFAITNADVKSPDIVCDFVCHDEVLLAVPENHPLACKGVQKPGKKHRQIDISLFREDSFILQLPDQRTRKAADYILKKAGFTPSVLLETRSIDASVGLVCEGVGVCFTPETYIQERPFSSKPVYFSLGIPEAIYNLSITYLKHSYRPQYFRDFIRISKDCLLLKYN